MTKLKERYKLELQHEDKKHFTFRLRQIEPKTGAEGRDCGKVAHFSTPNTEDLHLGTILLQASKMPFAYRGEVDIEASVLKRFARPKSEVMTLAEGGSLALLKSSEMLRMQCLELGSCSDLVELLEKVELEVGQFFGTVHKTLEAKKRLTQIVTEKVKDQDKTVELDKENKHE
jgi:hypothetical protein